MLQSLTPKLALDAFDSERLECLGDSILKFVSTVDLFKKYPDAAEGQLTSLRCAIISNSNLALRARDSGVAVYLRSNPLAKGATLLTPPAGVDSDRVALGRSLWGKHIVTAAALKVPISNDNRLVVDTEVTPIRSYHTRQFEDSDVSEKIIADLVESIIGSYFCSGGYSCAAQVIRSLGIQDSREYFPSAIKIPGLESVDLSVTQQTVDFIESRFGYKFKNLSLVEDALTAHRKLNNQRLEFLGDAVLDAAVTALLFHSLPDAAEGVLTMERSKATCNANLARLGLKMGLHEHLQVQITLRSLLLSAGTSDLHEPKLLADAFEALIGAVYLDSGEDMAVIERIVGQINLLGECSNVVK